MTAALSRRAAPCRLPGRRRLTLEALEDRTVPSAVRFITPLGGTPYQDWTISNYVDQDSDYLSHRDYQGGQYSYDGHDALDIALPNFAAMDVGVPVFAAAAGVVTETHDGEFDRNTVNNSSPANYVAIDHGSGCVTYYYHLRRDSVAVAVGESVTAGQVIGLVGSSGNSTDPHLHFAVYQDGVVVETYQTPGAYWLSPLRYAGDAPTVFDFGISPTDPVVGNPFLKQRPEEQTVFPQAPGQALHFWTRLGGVAAGDALQFDWLRPNGSTFVRYTPPRDEVPFINYGFWYSTVTLPSVPDEGDWQIVFSVNGSELARESFTISRDGADLAGQFQFSAPEYTITEQGGAALITVTRSGSAGAASVRVQASSLTASAGDYSFAAQTLAFADGELSTTFNLPVVQDAADEANETLRLTLSQPTGGATLGQQATTVVRLIDDDRGRSLNERYVDQVYRDLLRRPADSAGLAYWAEVFDQGASRVLLPLALSASSEYVRLQINDDYQALLGRAADAAALDFFATFVQSGGSPDVVRALLVGSEEYFARNGDSDLGFLQAAYRDVVGRALDPSGQSFFTSLLAAGVGRVQVALTLLATAEAKAVRVQQSYQDLLGQTADSGGLSFWANALSFGFPEAYLTATLIGTPEYLAQVG